MSTIMYGLKYGWFQTLKPLRKPQKNSSDWYAQSYESPGNQYVGSVEAV